MQGFLPGMTISNEPGYYEEGAFGIRIENVCVTVEADVVHHFGGRRYCKLETGGLQVGRVYVFLRACICCSMCVTTYKFSTNIFALYVR